jgi:pyruvate/2-oxoacid:ferredoxin oxidoreductase alpha subunit
MEPVEMPDQEMVDRFLPPVALPQRLDVDNPGFAVPTVTQQQFREYRKLAQEAMEHSIDIIERIDDEFNAVFGRHYGLVEAVECEDADLVILTTATITSTARAALAELREAGLKVGLFKLRVFRPFPSAAIRAALDHVPRIAVIERNISLGREGIFCSEVKAALVNSPGHPRIQGYLAGIGGTDVNPTLIKRVAHHALESEALVDGPIWMEED